MIGIAVVASFVYGLQAVWWGIVGGVLLLVVGIVMMVVAARPV